MENYTSTLNIYSTILLFTSEVWSKTRVPTYTEMSANWLI